MKFIGCTLFLFVSFNLAISQSPKYIPFPDSNYAWVVQRYDEFAKPNLGYQYTFYGDTIIDSVKYNNLVLNSDSLLRIQNPTWWRGIRNDTTEKKVFVYVPGSNKEYVLYDFSLNLGDTVGPDLGLRYTAKIVSRIDSILIKGNYHKVFHFELNSGTLPYIEGIGSLAGLFESPIFFEGGADLLCTKIVSPKSTYFLRNGISSCDYFHNYTSITEFKKGSLKLVVSYSSNGVRINLESPNDSRMKEVTIYNSNGALLLNERLNSESFDVENSSKFSAGLFIVMVKTDSGKVLKEKFFRK